MGVCLESKIRIVSGGCLIFSHYSIMSQQQEDKKSQDVSGGGVILEPSSRSRTWCLTVNNYNSTDLSQVTQLSQKSRWWIIGKEGKEGSATPHLQCYFSFNNQTRFSTLKRAIPRGHWEVAKGTRDQNYKYCAKEGDFETNIVPKLTRDDMKAMVLAKYDSVVWKPWQQDVIDFLSVDPDSRTIRWIYEPTGNVGKSFLAKYLACREGTIISSGKANDIFNQVNTALESGVLPKVVILDVPRVVADYVSYQALEKLKDGCLYSGKYEGGVCIFPEVHVIAFSNQKPDLSKMSKDRWKLYEIKEELLYDQMIIHNHIF